MGAEFWSPDDPFEISMNANLLGIEIGGTKLQMVLGDDAGVIHQRWRLLVDSARGGTGIREQILATLLEVRRVAPLRAIGVGFGGPVDWRTGRICCSHQVSGWGDFEMGAWLSRESGLPVVVENDSNSATLAEATRGAGIGSDPVFYFNMGSGVGGGLVTENRIYHGAKPGEAEFGHLRLEPEGVIVEERCSGWAVDRRIRTLKNTAPESLLARLIGDTTGGESKHLAPALTGGDASARWILEELGEDLGFALSHVVHLFHPEVIVMGGGLSLVGEPLRAAVESALPRFVMEAFHPVPPVRLAGLGEDAVPVGALLLAARLG